MEQCKTCLFYNKKYDELRQSGNDIIGVSAKKQHYCAMYEQGISEQIISDKKECPERIQNN